MYLPLSALDPLHPLEQFKQAAPKYLPGLLAFFDLADTKRRNIHLGHMAIDHDIAEFDRLLCASVGSTGMARRVGGDLWLAIYPEGTVSEGKQVLGQVLDDYRQEKSISHGWRCRGHRDGVVEIVERIVDTTISRAARCVYFSATGRDEMNTVIYEMMQIRWTFAPSGPVSWSEIGSYTGGKWQCVFIYPDESPFCPFCKGRAFEWEDGDGTIYNGGGTCKNCKADIDIRGVELNAR